MPIYRYECDKGHEFEFMRPMKERNEPLTCPEVIAYAQDEGDFGPTQVVCDAPSHLIPPHGVNGVVVGGTPRHH